MIVRDATIDDAAALTHAGGTKAMHQKRLAEAVLGDLRYLVLDEDRYAVVGYACLYFRRPESGYPDADESCFPRIVDLMIASARRRCGLGRNFMAEIEFLCKQTGFDRLHLSVDPVENSAAVKFYMALGYKPLRGEPQWRTWSYLDSESNVQRGEGMDLELVKAL